jgi:transposase-like protein
VLQLLMETDVEGLIGAGRYERSGERTTWRNGYRDRTLDTRLGSLQLRQSLPSRKRGQLLPAVSGSPQSSEKALIAVACRPAGWTIWCRRWAVGDQQVAGFQALQEPAPAKAGEIDERVHAFLERLLAGEWPYLWLDATYLKQREGGRIVSVAAIIAVAANSDGRGPSAHGLDLWGSSSLSRSSSSRLASSGDRGPPPAFAGAGSCSRRSTTAGR